MRTGLMASVLLLASVTGAGAQAQATAAHYLVCMRHKIDQLDDKTSDARTVAAAVMQSCQEERAAHKQALAGVDRTRAFQLMDVSRDRDLDQVTVVVLQERAKARR